MTRSCPEVLAAECDVFCRYLLGQAPVSDVVAAYQRAHDVGSVRRLEPTVLDRALLDIARLGPALVHAADAFASVAARPSLLRRKLVLLLAILESRGSSAAVLDTVQPGSRVLWLAGLAGHAARWALAVVAGAALVMPRYAWLRLTRAPA
jgi:hypothetical protein